MPLVRIEVRNEYRLGQSELYKEASKRDDPKALLDGVAVSGLVGILRQLGDLAEFAAEVFHGLQEQVTTTASRSHELMSRVQKIEAALPSLEKAVLAQTSHIHFAYTAGSEWHSRIQNRKNHFIYNDLPRFILGYYEECRDPPRLHLLDKFDTGGPGSCLKRYSDPTFFRRASGDFKEPDAEKIQKDRKARKTKKKRSRRNLDFLRSASMPNQSARMSLTTPTVKGKTSPLTASSTDMTWKSYLGGRSNSFDSRTGLAYGESVWHLSPSAQPEEQEFKEFSVFLHHNDVGSPVVSEGQPDILTSNFHNSSSPEPVVPSSSCDTWDEKAEGMEPEDVKFDEIEDPQPPLLFTADSDPGNQKGEIVDLAHADKMDSAFDNENMPKSIGDESDEIESEPDDFVDALNTIESESENDIDCQMKNEVEQFSSRVEGEGIEDELNKVAEYTSDDPSKNESYIAFDLSTNKGTASDIPNGVPSDSLSHEHASHISGDPSHSDNFLGIESSADADALDSPKVDSIVGVNDTSSSGCGMSSTVEASSDDSISTPCKSQEPQAQMANVLPVSFWTNGGLLGLEPSKPPDFAVAKTSSNDSKTRSNYEVVSPLNHVSILCNDEDKAMSGRLVKDDGATEVVVSSESNSQVIVQDTEAENVDGYQVYGERHKTPSVVKPGKELPLDVNMEATGIQKNEDNSSQIFGLGHRLLINSFRRKILLTPQSEPELANPLKIGVLDQNNDLHSITCHAASDKTFNGKFECQTHVCSFTSSPPLEHMKISFNPIVGFESSKLNLKFPDENHGNGSIRDAFPAFHLVPEPAISLEDARSDSDDDDTFCRSSPYMSDDCPSRQSYSDSEQWESNECPENKDQELYDSLCRMSLVESVSSSLRPAEMDNNGILINSGLKSVSSTENGVDHSVSFPMLDLPSFEVVNPVIPGELKAQPINSLELPYPQDPKPSPPPPPPAQWCTAKTTANMEECKQNTISEAHEHPVDQLTVSQQHKPTPANDKQTDEEAIESKPRSKEQWPQKDANLPADAKGMDENDDFLHQIRTKSFTLRRTVTAKPTITQGPTGNEKVTAILEKAIAIRQAVGSDDGEDDDTWSDN